MNCRRHGSKPTIAFWMLIAIADAAMLVAASGVTLIVLVALAVALAVAGVAAFRLLSRRETRLPSGDTRRA